MRAIGIESMNFIIDFYDNDFGILDALYFCFLLLTIFELNARKTFELEFLCHFGNTGGQGVFGDVCGCQSVDKEAIGQS